MSLKTEKPSLSDDINLDEVCRVCFRKSTNSIHIFSPENNYYTNNNIKHIAYMIMACASVQILENDGLPQQICNRCAVVLNIAYEFKQECEDSDVKLRQYLQIQSQKGNHISNLDANKSTLLQFQYQQIHLTNSNGAINIQLLTSGSEQNSVVKLEQSSVNTDYLLTTSQIDENYNSNDVVEEETLKPELENNDSEKPRRRNKKFKARIKEVLEEVDDGKGGKIRRIVTVHQCDTCGKTFKRREYLTQHIRIHTGEKPYRCHLCDKRFINSGHLTTHIRTHTGVKPHQCSLCPKKFSTRQELTKHTMVHNGERPFQCHICLKRFGSSSNMYTHMRHHTGEKNFTCELCGKAFYTKQELKQHFVIHTGERSFLCEICNKRFAQIAHLKRHSKLHK